MSEIWCGQCVNCELPDPPYEKDYFRLHDVDELEVDLSTGRCLVPRKGYGEKVSLTCTRSCTFYEDEREVNIYQVDMEAEFNV